MKMHDITNDSKNITVHEMITLLVYNFLLAVLGAFQ
jgi:hypothetical protein